MNILFFILIITLLLIISFVLAVRSMGDFKFQHEIAKRFKEDSIKGTIVFLADKVVHIKGEHSKKKKLS